MSVVATGVAVALVATAGVSAANGPNTVALKVRVTGLGTIGVTGNHSYTCRSVPCIHTFHVVLGRRIVVTALPAKSWKRTSWTGACKGAAAKCSLRVRGWRIVSVTFVPPGDLRNPYPLGTAHTLAGGWRVKIHSATIDATAEVEAVVDTSTGQHPNAPPPAGAHYTLVNLSLTHAGSGSGNVHDLLSGRDGPFSSLSAQGDLSGQYVYPPDVCEPPQPDLGDTGHISGGQTVTANLCYEIPSQDASTIRLSGEAVPGGLERFVWFALR